MGVLDLISRVPEYMDLRAYGFLPCCSFKYLSFFKGCKCWEMFFVNPLVTARILWIAGIVIILV
jgi:hypothetical protein